MVLINQLYFEIDIPNHVPARHKKIVKKIYIDANTKFPEENKLSVSLENAEKVVKAPKKPTNNSGLYMYSNLGSKELIKQPRIKQPIKFTPIIPIGKLNIVNLSSTSAR